MEKKVWIATSNAHKLEEFQEMLGADVEIKSFKDLKEPIDIVEDGKTFEENALIKARALYERVHEPVFADDSGLEVDAMDKAPGVYSARFMGEDTSYAIKNDFILRQVEGKTRTARYVCAIAYVDGSEERVYRGEVEGEISEKPIGSNGFGYDPIFYYPPYQTTLANVSDEKKHAISHRGIALRRFLEDQNQ
ncbi:RdgB/HAM1 family non-canonical purine NTP pyrophosphatase [Dubosiella muris]|uniref:RdgB/HAM1 family non-canonical purine NTP pyrophosphatase n=2 Tax=Dubosiella TaxID=1937008 RepID=A0AC61RBM8_9FIRM|nr:RdgB/HAM1 family non-canonical purine NTP pyrophosphatase [Dubosiella muris]TGY66934.1 RdgB/HAM1 family non-canonical purine NTP pyrophosphatase [Dubosiella muris]